MLQILPIPALNDNYIWMIVHPNNSCAAIVDPGEAKPVIDALQQHQLSLAAILITHHHWDHTNGIKKIIKYQKAPVYTPANDHVSPSDYALEDNASVHIDELELDLTVIDIPGHTLGHIAYFGVGSLFCGDTLFTGGCGRIFEGTAEQMFNSLTRLTQLPSDTLVYCGHEYTTANLHFAQAVEPDNTDLVKRIEDTKTKRQQNLPTVPATMATEITTNPFLRCHINTVQQAINQHYDQTFNGLVEYFSALREWKNNFRG